MALTNTVTITFNADFQIGGFMIFRGYMQQSLVPVPIEFIETWVSLRTGANQVSFNSPTGMPGERSAIDFITSFNLDYGHLGFSVNRTGNVVTINKMVTGQDA